MGIIPRLLVETFGIYHYASSDVPNDLGEMSSPTTGNLTKKGEVTGRITPGDSVEPDILGTVKDYDVDTASMWIGFFDIPSGFDIQAGDIVQNKTDSTRYFQVQFIDRYPGGLNNHHYECRLQTTEVMRRT